jgi:hypothetical protein
LKLSATPALSIARPALVGAGRHGRIRGGSRADRGLRGAQLDVPIIVHRGYGLPATAGNAGRLSIASSYSRETRQEVSVGGRDGARA